MPFGSGLQIHAGVQLRQAYMDPGSAQLDFVIDSGAMKISLQAVTMPCKAARTLSCPVMIRSAGHNPGRERFSRFLPCLSKLLNFPTGWPC